jgi:hypothetical protein
MAEIDLILEGEALVTEGRLREKLRAKLLDAMTEVAVDWLRHGFAGGHIVAAKRFAKAGSFPTKIDIEVERNFPVRGVSPESATISLSSKLKKKYADLLAEGSS